MCSVRTKKGKIDHQHQHHHFIPHLSVDVGRDLPQDLLWKSMEIPMAGRLTVFHTNSLLFCPFLHISPVGLAD